VDPPDLTLRSTGPDDTREAAAAIAPFLAEGDVVALSGELGAGKTCFVQGAARALGVTTRVTSPTFTLVRTYPSDPVLVHCDVYPLDRLQDVVDLGDEVLAPDVVTMIEWGDAISPLLPDDRLDIELVLADPLAPDGDRLIRVWLRGSWQNRHAELADACAPWREGAA